VVDAVQCAVAVQKEFQARNVETPESRRMEFRIGINLGDVIEEKERIYGDGVNIAARLEGLAKPGGICISKTAFDHIESKLPYGYEYLGDQTVKNIAKPVGAYHVLMEPRVTVAGKRAERKEASARRMPVLVGVFAVLVLAVAVGVWQFYIRRPSVEPASVDKMALPLPDKPSIAVLPFDNLSGDPDQEYLGDGLSEAIITALSYMPKLFVIARNSSFVYKGKPVKIQQVAEDLGVQYVMEGSFQKSGDRLRITAQLIDALTGRHLWADRYDRELKDIFALQDEIIQKILTSIRVKLTEGEQARVLGKSTSNLKVYLKYLQATDSQFSPASNTKTREMLEETIEIDPEFSIGYSSLGWTYLKEVWFGWTKSREKSMEMAVEFAQKALDLDESLPEAHALMGSICLGKRQYDKAITWGKRAVTLSPNNSGIMALFAITLTTAGKPEEAIPYFKKAIRLNPFPPAWYLNSLGWAYRKEGQYEDAIKAVKRALTINPKFYVAHLTLIANYGRLGRDSEAKAAIKEFLSLYPEFTITERLTKPGFDKDRAVFDLYIADLRKAGLK
jgi:adenylate cyclase